MVELSVLGLEVLGFEETCESCVFGKSGEFVCVCVNLGSLQFDRPWRRLRTGGLCWSTSKLTSLAGMVSIKL